MFTEHPREPLVHLRPELFTASPRCLVQSDGIAVTTRRSDRGVELLDISTDTGRITVLPYIGQQIWDAQFHERTLTMRNPFADPIPTADYLSNNGAYLIHCGGSAMGNPSAADTHSLHGELPNARLDSAAVRLRPAGGPWPSAVTDLGELTHRTAFGPWFSAELALTVTAGSSLMESVVRLTNNSGEARPLMYLAHVNFRPAVGGHLEEALSPESSIRTRGAADAPPVTSLLEPGRVVSPELVQAVPVQDDAAGWRTCQQIHVGGAVDVVQHFTPTLTHTLRWMRRTADDDAFAFAMPATAEPDGYLREREKGNVTDYPPGGTLVAHFRHGALRPGEPLPPTPRGAS